MSIKFDPAALLKKIAPEKKIKKLIKGNLSINKAALSFVDDIDFINKKDVLATALKVAKNYKQRVADETADKSDLKDDPKLLIQRIQNQIVFEAHEQIKDKYGGEIGVWLPSSAVEPRPEHQLNYGKEYVIGEGIDGVEPGDEYGCQCGVNILVPETKLEL